MQTPQKKNIHGALEKPTALPQRHPSALSSEKYTYQDAHC